MASFEKLTRANMMKQIQDLEDEERPAKKAKDDDNDVNKPGSKAYLERRQKQAEKDFEEAGPVRRGK